MSDNCTPTIKLNRGKEGGKLRGWNWYHSLGCPKFIMSPMVGQSELAFRMLCRGYGVDLCYTPMFIADSFADDEKYRNRVWSTCKEDRPLIVQFCGRNPESILESAKIVQKHCDAIDLNLGCPQKVAKRSRYGAWMMDDWHTIGSIVRHLDQNLNIPVTVKIRVFDNFDKTYQYCRMLCDAGASLISIHPRQKHEREEVLADWAQVKRIKKLITCVPIILNGDCWHAEDVWLSWRQTNADGIMSAQGLLHNPALFMPLVGIKKPSPEQVKNCPSISASLPDYMRRRRKISAFFTCQLSFSFRQRGKANVNQESLVVPSSKPKSLASTSFFSSTDDVKRQFELARRYVSFVEQYKVHHPSIARRHIFFILFDQIQANIDLYDQLYFATDKTMKTCAEYASYINALYARAKSSGVKVNKGSDGATMFNLSGKKRPRRRDNTLAPPPWPVGGGGFHVNKKRFVSNKACIANKIKKCHLIDSDHVRHNNERQKKMLKAQAGKKRRLSKAERKKLKKLKASRS